MSLYIPIYDLSGSFLRNLDLDPSIFSADHVVPSLVHEFVVMYLSNKRQSTAHTKNRSEVQASGKKLYRQKGTGGARAGNAGSPIRRKGGVVFGPRSERNYEKFMNKKMKVRALQSALIMKAQNNSMYAIQGYEPTGKTKDFAQTLLNLPFNSSLLVILPSNDSHSFKSIRNIQRVSVTYSALVNPYDLVSSKNVLIVNDAFDRIMERLV